MRQLYFVDWRGDIVSRDILFETGTHYHIKWAPLDTNTLAVPKREMGWGNTAYFLTREVAEQFRRELASLSYKRNAIREWADFAEPEAIAKVFNFIGLEAWSH